ncbi:DUF397 domain-containing protein [Streptomyces sp. NPDC050610]|uniref:DUF397 domain-containing protein n=1 Tax=Streptomyces sp. NPDC050610 TaxID=3157097 RepID=UPI003431D8B3
MFTPRADNLAGAVWFKSSYSNNQGGNCVMGARMDDGIAVCDSKNPAGPALLFSGSAWAEFASALKSTGLGERQY